MPLQRSAPVAVVALLAAGAAVASATRPDARDAAYDPHIDPAQFTTHITNPYFPLTPGTRLVYAGVEGGEARHDVVTVTRQTRTILGVRCVVVRDLVTNNGRWVENTTDWYAQDKSGNVWYFGELSKTYEHGKVAGTAGSWRAGQHGAKPGIVMKGRPVPGRSYRQEYRPGVAEDTAKDVRLDATIRVRGRTFRRTLLTEETDPLKPKEPPEHKWYARGIGLVHVNAENGNEIVNFVRKTP
jgi:hypothetical protein